MIILGKMDRHQADKEYNEYIESSSKSRRCSLVVFVLFALFISFFLFLVVASGCGIYKIPAWLGYVMLPGILVTPFVGLYLRESTDKEEFVATMPYHYYDITTKYHIIEECIKTLDEDNAELFVTVVDKDGLVKKERLGNVDVVYSMAVDDVTVRLDEQRVYVPYNHSTSCELNEKNVYA